MKDMFRENFRKKMEAAGYNYATLAAAAGLKTTYVRDFLIGKSKNPGYEKLRNACRVLGETVESVSECTGATKESPIVTDPMDLTFKPVCPECGNQVSLKRDAIQAENQRRVMCPIHGDIGNREQLMPVFIEQFRNNFTGNLVDIVRDRIRRGATMGGE